MPSIDNFPLYIDNILNTHTLVNSGYTFFFLRIKKNHQQHTYMHSTQLSAEYKR